MDEPSPPPIRTPWRHWIRTLRPLASLAVFVGLVWWLTGGGAHAARFWWVLGLVFLVPIVGYLAFLGWIAISWIREGKRNVREAELRRRIDAPAPHRKRSPHRRR